MVPAGLGVVWFGGVGLAIAGILVGVLMWHEYWSVTTGNKSHELRSAFAGTFILILCLMFELGSQYFSVVCGAGLALIALLFILDRTLPFRWLIVGLAYISAAVLSLLLIRAQEGYGLFLTIAIMVSVWSTDIAAYFAGRGFGGPRLSPTNSPNKTWSGAAGAVVCAALIGAMIAGIIKAPLWPWLVFSGTISMVAQLGDLIQSGWKRRFGVKDSGNMIPGHGGVLDRLDSFSMALVFTGGLLLLFPELPVQFLGLDTE